MAGVAVLRLVGRSDAVQESGERWRLERGPAAFGELVDQGTEAGAGAFTHRGGVPSLVVGTVAGVAVLWAEPLVHRRRYAAALMEGPAVRLGGVREPRGPSAGS
ncbi:hypothetical protein [Streptomyces sp. NRRL F-2580]|uniref:hypothetical protein n=1 Tax=Streptomyces sp. NRRL F-2580 TaxID=1463841 RepID=UPI0004CB4D11|nr:hypothetical protein [Streptomyces sp. NRRL F-2580]